jgi:hypothetical protein
MKNDENALLAREQGFARIAAYRIYAARHCISDAQMRRVIRKRHPEVAFHRARFPVGSVVRSDYSAGIFLVVGHGYTGEHSNERGCYGCKITDRVFKKWEWIGPDRFISKPQPAPTT